MVHGSASSMTLSTRSTLNGEPDFLRLAGGLVETGVSSRRRGVMDVGSTLSIRVCDV